MKCIELSITPEDQEIKVKREQLKALVVEINKARKENNMELAQTLTAEANSLGNVSQNICGDREVLEIVINLLDVSDRTDMRRYNSIYNKLEHATDSLELTNEEHAWLIEKSDKINFGEKYKDSIGNMQDKFNGPIKRAIGRIQDKIEQAKETV